MVRPRKVLRATLVIVACLLVALVIAGWIQKRNRMAECVRPLDEVGKSCPSKWDGEALGAFCIPHYQVSRSTKCDFGRAVAVSSPFSWWVCGYDDTGKLASAVYCSDVRDFCGHCKYTNAPPTCEFEKRGLLCEAGGRR